MQVETKFEEAIQSGVDVLLTTGAGAHIATAKLAASSTLQRNSASGLGRHVQICSICFGVQAAYQWVTRTL